MRYNFAIKHHFCFFADRFVAPLFENQGAKYFDLMLMRNFNPLWRRDSHCVVAKVNENIDLVPMHKPIALLGFAFPIMALRPVLFINPLRNIMAHCNFRMSSIHFRSVASPCLLHLVELRFPPSEFIQTSDEITLVKSICNPCLGYQLLLQ